MDERAEYIEELESQLVRQRTELEEQAVENVEHITDDHLDEAEKKGKEKADLSPPSDLQITGRIAQEDERKVELEVTTVESYLLPEGDKPRVSLPPIRESGPQLARTTSQRPKYSWEKQPAETPAEWLARRHSMQARIDAGLADIRAQIRGRQLAENSMAESAGHDVPQQTVQTRTMFKSPEIGVPSESLSTGDTGRPPDPAPTAGVSAQSENIYIIPQRRH